VPTERSLRVLANRLKRLCADETKTGFANPESETGNGNGGKGTNDKVGSVHSGENLTDRICTSITKNHQTCTNFFHFRMVSSRLSIPKSLF